MSYHTPDDPDVTDEMFQAVLTHTQEAARQRYVTEIDGVPDRTVADVEREERAYAEHLSACLKRKPMSSPGGITVELIPIGKRKGTKYPTLTQAAKAIGVNISNIHRELHRRGNVFGGYLWRIRGRE